MKQLLLAAALAATPNVTHAQPSGAPTENRVPTVDARRMETENLVTAACNIDPVARGAYSKLQAEIDALNAAANADQLDPDGGRKTERFYGAIMQKALIDFLQSDPRYCSFRLDAQKEAPAIGLQEHRIYDEGSNLIAQIRFTHSSELGKSYIVFSPFDLDPESFFIEKDKGGKAEKKYNMNLYEFPIRGWPRMAVISPVAEQAVAQLKKIFDAHYKTVGEKPKSKLAREVDEIKQKGDLEEDTQGSSVERKNGAILHKALEDFLLSDPRYSSFRIDPPKDGGEFRRLQQFRVYDGTGAEVGLIMYIHMPADSTMGRKDERMYEVSSVLFDDPNWQSNQFKIEGTKFEDISAFALRAVVKLRTILDQYYKAKKAK